MQIKTVIDQSASKFDDTVNSLIREGWKLVRRDLIQASHNEGYFYAELERSTSISMVSWPEAVLAMHELCSAVEHCADCPAGDICTGGAPDGWNVTGIRGW